MDELDVILRNIEHGNTPKSIFGHLGGDLAGQKSALNHCYRHMAKKIHPDLIAAGIVHERATQATVKLNSLYTLASQLLTAGTYNDYVPESHTATPIHIRTASQDYLVGDTYMQADLANAYYCSYESSGKQVEGLFKVARHPHDNDLIEHEATALRQLQKSRAFPSMAAFFPHLAESFSYTEPHTHIQRTVNILTLAAEAPRPQQWYSLTELREHFAAGADARHMAWIFRRLLGALHFVHDQQMLHAAALPPHIWIEPEMHGLILADWSYALLHADQHERMTALPSSYSDWYPKVIHDKQAAPAGLDVLLAAKSMIYLLGGSPQTGHIPDAAQAFQPFFHRCLRNWSTMGLADTSRIQEEFDVLIDQVWGKRTHAKLVLPAKQHGAAATSKS